MSGHELKRLSAVPSDDVLVTLCACWRGLHEEPMTNGLALLYSEGRILLGVWIDEEETLPHWIDLYTGRVVRNVTHWMPIPEPAAIPSEVRQVRRE